MAPQKRAPSVLSDPNESLVQIATSLPEPEGLYSGQGAQAQRNEWGNAAYVFGNNLTPNNLGATQPVLSTPSVSEERDFTLVLQILPSSKLVPSYLGGGAYQDSLLVTVTYGVGAVALQKTVMLQTTAMKHLQLCCRNVQVSAQLVHASGSANPVSLVAAVLPGHVKNRDAYAWSDGQTIDNASTGILWPPTGLYTLGGGPVFGGLPQGVFSGCLGRLACVLESVASAVVGQNLYLLLFDEPPSYTLVGGEEPIAFGCSGAMVSVGQFVDYDGIEAPEAATFTTGLQFAISTTPGSYTAATGAVSAHVDCLIGQ